MESTMICDVQYDNLIYSTIIYDGKYDDLWFIVR